ncbi:MAG: hypothetical protein GY722_11265 [bacterium]|nr:hypothetical protein [bacterium]
MNRPPILLVAALVVAGCTGGGSSDSTDTTPPSPTTIADAKVAPSSPTTTTTWAPQAGPCAKSGDWGLCEIPDYDERPYAVFLPSSYDPTRAIPVVVALHGGGGKAEGAVTTTCAEGDHASATCLHNVAEREGFAVVYPNGSGFGLLPNLRTWNAGGGIDGYNCVSGQACERGVDDIAYFGTLLDHLQGWMNVDTGMIYATGLSNGAAMSHRLACEMSDRFTAIAAVGGTNQFAVEEHCDLTIALSILQIHGTDDPCWTYETSDEACADRSGSLKIGVAESTEGWVDRLGCEAEPAVDELPDVTADGMTTTRKVWSGCGADPAEVHLLTINGGGHTWPGGDPYLPERVVGPVTTDWDSALIWEFFSQFDRD